MAEAVAVKEPLGVGRLIGETFSLFFRKIHWFVLLAFLPGLFAAVFLLAIGGGVGLINDPLGVSAGRGVGALAFFVLVVAGALSIGFVTLAAYDAKQGRPFRLGLYVSSTFRSLVPMVICSIISTLMILVAAVALLIPGLWVAAVFSILMPAIVIERAGFGGLGRSVDLTKDYRWPIAGGLVAIWGCGIVLGAVQGVLLDPLVASLDSYVGVVLSSAVEAIVTGFMYIYPALLYARLREIKEGITPEQIVEVFE